MDLIEIKQNSTFSGLVKALDKYNKEIRVNLNRQMIKDDIERLKSDIQSIKNSNITNKEINVMNINKVIEYLERLIKKIDKADERGVNIKWAFNINRNGGYDLISYPIKLIEVPEYNIFTIDYINLSKNECNNTEDKLVYLDYEELADIIAFDMMFRDLGEDHNTIEDKLDSVGIIASSNCEVLTKHFKDSPYELSKVLYVDNSPYMVLNKNINRIRDYFGKREFKLLNDSTYRSAVSYSCRSAMALVVEGILNSKAEEVGLCSVLDRGIYIMINSSDEDTIVKALSKPVCIRAFGRLLEVEPKIKVF